MSTVPSTVLDALPDPIILVDAGRIVVAVNRAARDAFGPNLVGRDLSLGLRHPAVLTAVDRALAGTEEVTAEVSLPVPVPRTFLLRAVRLNPGIGDTAAVALVLSETTDTLRAEQMRADSVANASHELRSPLASVLGFIETIRGHAADDAAARRGDEQRRRLQPRQQPGADHAIGLRRQRTVDGNHVGGGKQIFQAGRPLGAAFLEIGVADIRIVGHHVHREGPRQTRNPPPDVAKPDDPDGAPG